MRILVVSSTGYTTIEAAFADFLDTVDRDAEWTASAERILVVVSALEQHPAPGTLWVFRSLLELVVCLSDNYDDSLARISTGSNDYQITYLRSKVRVGLIGATNEHTASTAEDVATFVVHLYRQYTSLFGEPVAS